MKPGAVGEDGAHDRAVEAVLAAGAEYDSCSGGSEPGAVFWPMPAARAGDDDDLAVKVLRGADGSCERDHLEGRFTRWRAGHLADAGVVAVAGTQRLVDLRFTAEVGDECDLDSSPVDVDLAVS